MLWPQGSRVPVVVATPAPAASLYDRNQCLVRIAGSESELFTVRVGLR